MTNRNFFITKAQSEVQVAKLNNQLFLLTHTAAIEVISAFLSGSISKEELADWADFFDINEDVELESEEILPNILFELANPEINSWPDYERAMQLLGLLTRP